MNIQILTPDGYKDFDGVKRYWHEEYLLITFNDYSTLETVGMHRFIVDNKEIYAVNLKPGDYIGKTIKSIEHIKTGAYFYDPINVQDGEIYSHDDCLISHNSFHGRGDTLVSTSALLKLKAMPAIDVRDNINVYKQPIPGHNYIMTVDVSKGRGQDYSTWNLVDISSNPFQQVCTFRDNNISPLILPDYIEKYATIYNEAYVIIESNDQGAVVCNGLYYDLEYENMHVESFTKADAIGCSMTTKVKRIGCTSMKDLIESHKLDIYDAETIKELSTFVSKGKSFEASKTNTDDLVMNLVMLGWFATTDLFRNLTLIDMRTMMYEQKIKDIQNDMLPFGVVDGYDDPADVGGVDEDGDHWFPNN